METRGDWGGIQLNFRLMIEPVQEVSGGDLTEIPS